MQIDLLDRGLQNLAERIVETTSVRVRDISGFRILDDLFPDCYLYEGTPLHRAVILVPPLLALALAKGFNHKCCCL